MNDLIDSAPFTAKLARLRLLASLLRSGSFLQATSHLRIRRSEHELTIAGDDAPKDKFCCLGVACEIARKEADLGKWEEARGPSEDYGFIDRREDSSRTILTYAVARWFGIDTHGEVTVRKSDLPLELWERIEETFEPPSVFVIDKKEFSLYEANDYGFDFDEIAQLIEAHVANAADRRGVEVPDPLTPKKAALAADAKRGALRPDRIEALQDL